MNEATRVERIVLETSRHRIVGDITLPQEGYKSRLSDRLNEEGLTFIPLVNVMVTDLHGGQPAELDFIAVARDHVQVAYDAPE
jgi:hypothetical protein